MLVLITRTEKYKSGTMLEVCDVGGDDHCREAELLNEPGPPGPASKTSCKWRAVEDIFQILGVEESALGSSQGASNE